MLFFYWKTCDFYVVMTKIRFMSMLYLVYRHPVYMGDVAQWKSASFACLRPRVRSPASPQTISTFVCSELV